MIELGLNLTMSNILTEAYQQGNYPLFRRRFSVTVGMTLSIVVIGVLLLIGVTAYPHWSAVALAGRWTGSAWKGQLSFLMLSLATILTIALGILTTVYRAQGQFSRGLAVSNAGAAARISTTAIAAALGATIPVVAAINLIVTLFMLVCFVPKDMRKSLTDIRFEPSLPNRGEWRIIFATAPWLWAQVISNNLLLNAPLFVLSFVAQQPGVLASFTIARMMVNLARQIIYGFANATAIELAARGLGSASRSAVVSSLLSSTRLFVVLNTVTVVATVFILEPFVQLWSGGRVGADAGIAVGLALGALGSGSFLMFSNYLNYSGHPSVVARVSCVLQLLITVVGALVLVPPFGAVGVAFDLSIAEVVATTLVLLPTLASETGIPLAHVALRCVGLTLLGGAVVAIVGLLLQLVTDLSPFSQLIFRSACLALVSLAVVLVLGASSAQRYALFQNVMYFLQRCSDVVMWGKAKQPISKGAAAVMNSNPKT